MTDPRAALAEALRHASLDHDLYDDRQTDAASAVVAADLAERGVLLVTEAMLIQAIRIVISPTDAVEDGPAIFAALSGEAP